MKKKKQIAITVYKEKPKLNIILRYISNLIIELQWLLLSLFYVCAIGLKFSTYL